MYITDSFFCRDKKHYVFRDTFLCPESRVTNSSILSTAYALQTLVTCALSFLVMCLRARTLVEYYISVG